MVRWLPEERQPSTCMIYSPNWYSRLLRAIVTEADFELLSVCVKCTVTGWQRKEFGWEDMKQEDSGLDLNQRKNFMFLCKSVWSKCLERFWYCCWDVLSEVTIGVELGIVLSIVLEFWQWSELKYSQLKAKWIGVEKNSRVRFRLFVNLNNANFDLSCV